MSMSLRSHSRATLILAWPVIAGQIGQMVIQQVDTIMIGALGSTQLAAASLAGGTFFFLAVIGFGISMAISPLTAQALGAGQPDAARSHLQQGLWTTVWVGLLITALLFAFTELLPYLGQKPEVVAAAQPFMRVLALSVLPMLLFLSVKSFVEGFEDTRPGMVITGITVLFNVFFNWLLIYGNWGAPELGLVGAGYATLISRTAGALMMMAYHRWAPRFRTFQLERKWWRHDWEGIKAVLRLGLPTGFQYFFEIGAFAGAVLLAGQISEDAQSAHQIAIQIASVTYMFYMGVGAASSIRVGNAFGKQDADGIRSAGMASFYIGLVFVALSVAAMLLLRNVLPGVYIRDVGVQEMATRLMVIAALFQVFDGIQAIMSGTLRGMSDVKIPTAITFVAYWIVGLPGAYLAANYLDWGLDGIWYGLTAGLAFSATFLTWRFFRRTRLSASTE